MTWGQHKSFFLALLKGTANDQDFLVEGRGLAYEQQKTCNLIGF